jgi:cytochrome c oxidase subunit 4
MATAHEEPNYIAVWIWLAALTVVEIWIANAGLHRMLVLAGLVGLAIAKAALVAMYFMHLRFERQTLALIALTPPLLLLLLTFAVYPDALGAAFDRGSTSPKAATHAVEH